MIAEKRKLFLFFLAYRAAILHAQAQSSSTASSTASGHTCTVSCPVSQPL